MTVIHTAGPPQLGGLHQQCARCSYVLQDYTGSQPMVLEDQADRGLPTWPVGRRIAVRDNATWVMAEDAPLDDDETECQAGS